LSKKKDLSCTKNISVPNNFDLFLIAQLLNIWIEPFLFDLRSIIYFEVINVNILLNMLGRWLQTITSLYY